MCTFIDVFIMKNILLPVEILAFVYLKYYAIEICN